MVVEAVEVADHAYYLVQNLESSTVILALAHAHAIALALTLAMVWIHAMPLSVSADDEEGASELIGSPSLRTVAMTPPSQVNNPVALQKCVICHAF
jgi:hypothetical protein